MMKFSALFLKLPFLSVILISFNSFASDAEFIEVSSKTKGDRSVIVSGESLIQNAEEFDFLHCEPMQDGGSKLAVHYIIKMDNFEAKKLYITSAAGGTKASELKNLAMVNEELTPTDGESQDLGFSSGQMCLRFSLTIRDSNGQLLEGTLFDKSQQIPIKCLDVTLE